MDWIITTTVFLSVLKAALCFNIEPVAWKTLTQPAAGFGYQVVQRQSDLLVSAPLAQYSRAGRGQIYKCSTESCSLLRVPTGEYAVNMSLGLTMASDPVTQNTLACGPTIPKDCKSITMYSGKCFQIDRSNGFAGPIPSSDKECQSADIAFLLDGSGSVGGMDFQTMKTFVKDLVRSLLPLGAQFAIAQFSSDPEVHFFFDNFLSGTTPWETKVDRIQQQGETTYTARAIEYVVRNIFTPARGSRANMRKVLIVITDGVSHDRRRLPIAADLAEKAKIIRFAIGVGDAFTNAEAKKELDTIASSPTENVFQVESFDALEKIRKSLQEKLFAIEGSQSGESLKLEMAQEGFSAAFVPEGIQMAVVGANVWKGGYHQYSMSAHLKSFFEPNIDADSYLGYSMAVAKTRQGTLTIVGAPRYRHHGAVLVVPKNQGYKMIDPSQWQFQSGEYFGAAVCAMDVNGDSYTDLILISAPMFVDTDREGRVYVCSLTVLNVECHLDSPSVLRGDASDSGRFGSSLAVLPDLNTDDLNDLAVGAPLENNGQGSIYIFHGEGGGRLSSTYSQRIAGSEVGSGLKFFGMSISQSSFDQSNDALPDLAVGSKGSVILLRSKPIVMVEATVSFKPNKISTQTSECSTPLKNTVEICFTMTKDSTVNQAQARISYNLTLDATRKVPNNRAYVTAKQREMNGTLTLVMFARPICNKVEFSVEACPDDALNALNNELRFTFEGLPIGQNPSPSLALQAQTTEFHPLGFEINCGTDDKCVDNLKVDFNFTSSLEVKVGIDELLNVTVSVENSEENSYNSRVILTYPVGLSFRKFTSLQGRIECNSLDSEDGITRGKTDCTVNKPILKNNAKAFFTISYGIETNSQLDRRIFVSANATSGNVEHATSSELYKIKEIEVKYSIFATLESPLSYSNFSFGKNLRKPVQQSIVVSNDIRALDFTVVIRVPVKLGDKDIWVDSSSLQIPDCRRDKEEIPNVTDFVAEIKKNKLVDCSVARCMVFKCSRFMGRLESKKYNISANLSSGWIEQIGLRSAKFLLTSTASLEYDRDQYIFFSTGSYNNPPVRKIEVQVDVYSEPDFTKEIVGGSLGGLAFLALLTAGLYKAGFFKSKYKDMIKDDAANPGVDGGEPTPE